MPFMSAAMVRFQSTPSRGGRRSVFGALPPSDRFQSTPSRGGRLLPQPGRREQHVSIHALAGRATSRRGSVCSSTRSFNPHPRGEGDQTGRQGDRAANVSIHALAGRATAATTTPCIAKGRFNPRPRGEGDRGWRRDRRSVRSFNPRPRGEGDRGLCSPRAAASRVSIHALAGRATVTNSGPWTLWRSFNPRPRGEGDQAAALMPHLCDVSIHALAGRATIRRTRGDGDDAVSIHALAGRATRTIRLPGPRRTGFNPRPRGEGDILPVAKTFSCNCFNPRPRGEGDGRRQRGSGIR